MNMFLFFSHFLTDEQKKDAMKMGVENFINLPDNLQNMWSNVPVELENIEEYSKPFMEFLDKNAKKGDYALIQGDFVLTCKLVNFAKKTGVVPVYSTTKREVVEKKEDDKITKISKFKHIKFRKY